MALNKKTNVMHNQIVTKWYYDYMYSVFVVSSVFLTPKNVGNGTKIITLCRSATEIWLKLNIERRPF